MQSQSLPQPQPQSQSPPQSKPQSQSQLQLQSKPQSQSQTKDHEYNEGNDESVLSTSVVKFTFIGGRFCNAGEFQSSNNCEDCPANTYSVGSGEVYLDFLSTDISPFTTFCGNHHKEETCQRMHHRHH